MVAALDKRYIEEVFTVQERCRNLFGLHGIRQRSALRVQRVLAKPACDSDGAREIQRNVSALRDGE
jgi:hypothetical protein